MFQCNFCEAQHATHKAIIDHTIQFHQHHPAFSIECEVQDCPGTFTNVNSYYSHKRRHHQREKLPRPTADVGNPGNPANPIHEEGEPMDTRDSDVAVHSESLPDGNGGSDISDGEGETGLHEWNAGENDIEVMSESALKETAADFVLHLRANTNISDSALEETVAMSAKLIKSAVANYAENCKSVLKQHYVMADESKLPSVDDHSRVFSDIMTVKKQDKYFQEHLHLVQPDVKSIGEGTVQLGKASVSSNRKSTINYPKFTYIPIIKTINRLLQSGKFQKLLSEDCSAEEGYFKCYSDGTLFKSNQFFENHPDALRIILYYDDVDPCDALGSKSGKHKLGFFYMTFDNIPLKFRSTLDAIYLVAIANSADIKEHGIDSILQPIVTDLKKLENGVRLEDDKMVFAILIAFIGDNLAIHCVGGFKEGFTALHPCRTCMASLLQVRNAEGDLGSLLRSKEVYSDHIRMMREAFGQEFVHLSTQFGINREPLLNELQYFHVLDGLPPDGMHDVLEGALSITVKLVIAKVVQDKLVTLKQINEHLKNFDYGYSESKNKPSEIKSAHLTEDGNLHQSAAQMWLLAVILPLTVGPYVEVGSGFWEPLEYLLQACSIIFSRKISQRNLTVLEICLSDYVEGFKKHLRPTLIPKQHFLLHYVHHIKRFGPLTAFWCMRMEARHQYFKGLARRMRNFKNIQSSLVKKNMLWEAWALKKSKVTLLTKGDIEKVCVANYEYKNLLHNPAETIFRCEHVRINGISFMAGKCCVAVEYNETEKYPIFAFVREIIFLRKQPIFVCHEMKTIEYDVHLCAFEVEETNNVFLCPYERLLTEDEVFHSHVVLNRKYIITKRCLGNLC